jgi:Uma2 family endonuclease
MMATASLQPPAAAATPAPEAGLPEGVPYRLSAEDYFRMVDTDIIPNDSRVGLWEGRLYEKMPKNLAYAAASSLIMTALFRAIPDGWFVSLERPIVVDEFTVPFPDVSVVRGDPDLYCQRGSQPKVNEIGLAVEIADPSLKKNLLTSLQTYAAACLAAYWVVNLESRRVEVYSDPQPAGGGGAARYAKAEEFGPGQDVPLVLDGRDVARIPVNDLLP